jgi:Flp pilus assembly protein TadD
MQQEWIPKRTNRSVGPAVLVAGLLALSACATPRPELTHGEQLSLEQTVQEGDALRDAGNLPEAMLTYLRAHRLDKRHAVPRERIAYLHLRKDPARAEKLFAELAKDAPESASAFRGLGLAQLARERLTDARKSLERSAELDPKSGATHSALGVIHDRLGDHERAQGHYWQAMIFEPDDFEIPNNLGVSYLLSKDYEAAVEIFKEAARLNPEDRAVHNNLGLALGLLKRYDEALAEFRAAGSEEAARNNLAYVHYLNQEYEAAIEHYGQALLADGQEKLPVLQNLGAAQRANQDQTGPEGARSTGARSEALRKALSEDRSADQGDGRSQAPSADPSESRTEAQSPDRTGDPTGAESAAPTESAAPSGAESADQPEAPTGADSAGAAPSETH